MKRVRGDEAVLLREVLERAIGMLRYYGLVLSYTIDIEDNSYTTTVNPEGLDGVGVLIRLDRYKRFEAILTEIVSAPDDTARERAIQRARCELDDSALRLVE